VQCKNTFSGPWSPDTKLPFSCSRAGNPPNDLLTQRCCWGLRILVGGAGWEERPCWLNMVGLELEDDREFRNLVNLIGNQLEPKSLHPIDLWQLKYYLQQNHLYRKTMLSIPHPLLFLTPTQTTNHIGMHVCTHTQITHTAECMVFLNNTISHWTILCIFVWLKSCEKKPFWATSCIEKYILWLQTSEKYFAMHDGQWCSTLPFFVSHIY
jgi:hypothetical protein